MNIAFSEKARELHDLGSAAIDVGDYDTAVRYLRAATTLAPHFKTLELLGDALFRSGDLTESIVFLAAAAGLSPKQVRSRLLLARVFEKRGEIASARIQLEEALRVNPQYKTAREMLIRLPPPEEEQGLPEAET